MDTRQKDQVAQLRAMAAFWKTQYEFLRQICRDNNIDLKKYYPKGESE